MNQIMNIFRKDVRHLRLELLACLLILTLFALSEIRSWSEPFGSSRPAAGLSAVLAFVLYLAWAFLILRLVHGERLAGMNQFWTTRPYEWAKLLAAKVIFLLLFLYMPLFLVQLYLLYAAGTGISVDPLLPLQNCVRLTGMFVLPMLCIAAVTVSFAQTMLSLLGIAVGVTTFVAALQYAGSVSATLGVRRFLPMFLPPLILAIAIAFALLGLLLQYRRRLTLRSVAVLAAGVALIVVSTLTLEGSPASPAGFAAAPAGPPVSISVRSDGALTVKLLPKNPRTAVYRVPLKLSYPALDVVFLREAHRFTLTASDGYTWTSNWIGDPGMMSPEGAKTNQHSWVFIDIPWPVHDRLMSGPISIRMEFLMDQMQNDKPYTTQISREDQLVPGLGNCALDEEWRSMTCRYASSHSESSFSVQTSESSLPCPGSPVPADDSDTPAAPAPLPELIPVSGSAGSYAVGARFLSLAPFVSPVSSLPMNLWVRDRSQRRGHLCPGQPITFTRESVVQRFQVETQTATIVLKDTAR